MSSGGGAAAGALTGQYGNQTAKPVSLGAGQKVHTLSKVSKDDEDTLWVLIKSTGEFKKNQTRQFYEKLDDYIERVFKNSTVHQTSYNSSLNTVDIVYTGERLTGEPATLREEAEFDFDILWSKVLLIVFGALILSVIGSLFFS